MYLVQTNGGLELIYFIWFFFCIIGIPKHVIVTLMDVTSFAKIIVDMSLKCMSLTFCKPNHLACLVFIFNMPCGLTFMLYFNK